MAKRSAPIPAGPDQIVPLFRSQAAERGVPLFLSQLVDTLRNEQLTPTKHAENLQKTPAPTDIGRGAALHGADLLRRGYSVDQVVHDYGDVCQAITELAAERKKSVTVDEFRTLNRCLDDAIADAVTAYARGHDEAIIDNSKKLNERDASSAERQLQLIELAIQIYAAIRAGRVGLNGSTSTALAHSLLELRDLIRQSRPEIAPALRNIPHR